MTALLTVLIFAAAGGAAYLLLRRDAVAALLDDQLHPWASIREGGVNHYDELRQYADIAAVRAHSDAQELPSAAAEGTLESLTMRTALQPEATPSPTPIS